MFWQDARFDEVPVEKRYYASVAFAVQAGQGKDGSCRGENSVVSTTPH